MKEMRWFLDTLMGSDMLKVKDRLLRKQQSSHAKGTRGRGKNMFGREQSNGRKGGGDISTSVVTEETKRNYESPRGQGTPEGRGRFGGACFKHGAQWHKAYDCSENLNANRRKEGKTHVAQGVENIIGSVVGDNIDDVTSRFDLLNIVSIVFLQLIKND
jgi:hypothetical protein